MPPLHINGSTGEGGGQMLRSSLALSMALGVPFRITGIRANREKPGLMRQHLTALQAAIAISSARAEGTAVGSREVTFAPGPVRGGSYRFAVGTAGSVTLVLQAILPALLVAEKPSEVVIEGGTHARSAPTFEFLQHALVPLLARLGGAIDVRLEKHGFYPAGGGRVVVAVEPAATMSPLTIERRGNLVSTRALSIVSKLPYEVARRELEAVRSRLGWSFDTRNARVVDDAPCPGNALLLYIESEGGTDIFGVIGERQKSSERVAAEACAEVESYLESDAPIGPHLADQLMVPCAIAAAKGAGESSFVTQPLSSHSTTNSEIVAAFLGRAPTIESRGAKSVRWSIR